MARILSIDDDLDFLTTVKLYLEKLGHEVFTTNRPADAVKIIREIDPDLVTVDIMMPVMTGGDVYGMIRTTIGPDLPVIVCSATHLKVLSHNDPKMGHLSKPLAMEKLVQTIEQLLHTE